MSCHHLLRLLCRPGRSQSSLRLLLRSPARLSSSRWATSMDTRTTTPNRDRKCPHSLLQRASHRSFHLTRPVRINPFIVTILTPITRVGAIIAGRRMRRWYKSLPEEEKRKFKNKLKLHRNELAGVGLLLSLFVLFLYVTHLERCPITGRRRFVALQEGQVAMIGQREFENLLEVYKDDILPERHRAYAKVARVANQILKANRDMEQVHDKDWTITVVDSKTKNAFVLPGGNIFVFTGMLKVCSSDDELGIVLSHEIAHCLLSHAAENVSYVNFVNLLTMMPLALLWAVVPTNGVAIITDWFFEMVISIVFRLPFSREMENEADEVGLILASKACLDVRMGPKFWNKMAKMDAAEEALPEWVLTHPSHETRAAHLTELLPTALKLRLDCGCSKLGPEESFFRKGIFPRILSPA